MIFIKILCKNNPKVSFSINENVFNGTARVVDQEKESGLVGEVSKLMNTNGVKDFDCRTYSNKFNVAK
jgi:hypothetical protein